MFSCWVWWDDGGGAALCQPVAQAAGVIGAVGQEAAWRAGDGKERLGAVEIVPVACVQHEGKGAPGRVGQGVELAGPAPARASDGVGEGPPFAPAAERWTLMCVLSTDAVTPLITPVAPVSA